MRIPATVMAGMIFGAATAAHACGFHNYAPQPTLVDRLLDSDNVVLARPDPSNPFRFQATRAIEGSLDHVDLPFLVDSTSRRRLAADPEAAVLFARDGAYGPWQRVAFVDDEMRPVLDKVLAALPEWELGDDRGRFELFASLIGHPDRTIRTLALRELDRADYGFLISSKLNIDAGELAARLDDPNESRLRAIRVLLLGLSGDVRVLPRLERGLDSSLRIGGSLSGAYATAVIEMTGPEGARRLARGYLSGDDLPPNALEALVEALALHSQYGEPDMQATVDALIAEALRNRPELSATVARQFGARGVWTQAAVLAELVKRGAVSSPLDVLTVSQYVAIAEDASGATTASDTKVTQ